MNYDALKRSLINYPTQHWDADIDLSRFSKTQMLSALSEILEEHGVFPVPWGASGTQEGLSVVGSEDRYIGHWTDYGSDDDAGGIAVSTASEDLGDASMAAVVVFRTYFSNYTWTSGGDDDAH